LEELVSVTNFNNGKMKVTVFLFFHPPHQTAAQSLFSTLGLKVCTGHSYLGGFVGDPHKLDSWLLPKLDHWLSGIHQLAQAA